MADYQLQKHTWWIAHNNADVIHSGQTREGQIISTGQPFFEQFDNRADWEKRLTELGYSENSSINSEEEIIFRPGRDEIDHQLFTDSVDHLLYGEKEFRHIENPNKPNN